LRSIERNIASQGMRGGSPGKQKEERDFPKKPGVFQPEEKREET